VKTRPLLACALLVGCAPADPPPADPGPRWVYPPAPTGGTLGALRGKFGRSQAPEGGGALGLLGEPAVATVPLRRPTPWAVPGDAKARAVIDGFEGATRAIELVEIDAGRVLWRDPVHCAAPVVGVTADAILCADAKGVRAVSLDGKPRWKRDEVLAAITGDRVVLVGPTAAIAPPVKKPPPRRPNRPARTRDRFRPKPPAPVPATRATAIVVDAATGQDTARVALPPGIAVEQVLAACGTDELFALANGKLSRIVGAKLVWSIPSGAIAELDACTGDAIHVITPAGSDSDVIAIARATGAQRGRVDGVRGSWPARDDNDRVELATATGVASWSRDLTEYRAREDLPLGELLAHRGEQRLVRASPLTAVLLDRAGVHAYLPFAAFAAALGDTAFVGGTWVGDGEHVRRFAIPARTRRTVRVPARRGPVSLPAELRDLPKPAPLDLAAAIEMRDTGMHAVDAIVLDPAEPTVLYAIARERDGVPAGIASADLATRTWRWQRGDGCGGPSPVGLALVRDAIVCAARGTTSTIVATTRDGKSMWQWETDHLDAIAAAGDVVLGFAADRLFVLDAIDGRLRGQLASEDGAAMRATAVMVDGVALVVSYERGRLVVRSPNTSMIALWSLAVAGVVAAIAPSHEGVLVALDDGDAFRVDLKTAAVLPLPGFGLEWHAIGDLVTGEAIGGPIPAPPQPRPSIVKVPNRRFVRRPRVIVRPPPREPGRPAIWTPIPSPPPLGDSWQYTLFELTGGVRARNDYALVRPIEPSDVRGPAGSPLVVAHDAARQVLVLDPRNGDPLRRVALPSPGLVFGTIVDGTPVAGAVLASPLRVVMF
jgi:hypothetical protein